MPGLKQALMALDHIHLHNYKAVNKVRKKHNSNLENKNIVNGERRGIQEQGEASRNKEMHPGTRRGIQEQGEASRNKERHT
jgi:hypothetical protein